MTRVVDVGVQKFLDELTAASVGLHNARVGCGLADLFSARQALYAILLASDQTQPQVGAFGEDEIAAAAEDHDTATGSQRTHDAYQGDMVLVLQKDASVQDPGDP